MNLNINLKSKKSILKKIIILILFSILCFFIKENVFAMDSDGNTSNESVPPFLEEFYTMSTLDATCDDSTQMYCNMYQSLQQFFSEFHTLYKNVILSCQKSGPNADEYCEVFFFFDEPVIDRTDSNNYLNVYNSSVALITPRYRDSFGSNGFYKISFKPGTYGYVSSIRFYDYIDETSLSGLGCYYTRLNTNFNLYSSTNNILFHKSDVYNFTYINLKPKSGILLKPKHIDPFSSYFSYHSDRIYISYVDKTDTSIHYDYKKLNKPVTGSITYDFSFTSEYINKYYLTLNNFNSSTVKIGYIEDDFDIVTIDLTSPGVYDSDGNYYSNWMSGLNEDISSEVIFDTDKSILENIVDFFSHFGDFLMNMVNNLLNGISNLLKYLFVPGKELEGFFNEEYDFILKKLGFLTYPIEVIIDFANRFYSLEDSNSAIFKIPKLELMGNTLYEGTTFDLMSLVNSNDNFKNIYSIYKTAVSGFIVLWLVQLAIKKEQEMFGGGSN